MREVSMSAHVSTCVSMSTHVSCVSTNMSMSTHVYTEGFLLPVVPSSFSLMQSSNPFPVVTFQTLKCSQTLR